MFWTSSLARPPPQGSARDSGDMGQSEVVVAVLIALLLVAVYFCGKHFLCPSSPPPSSAKVESQVQTIGHMIGKLGMCSQSNPLRSPTVHELQTLWGGYQVLRKTYPSQVAAYRLYNTMAILEGDFAKLGVLVETIPLPAEDEMWRPQAVAVFRDLPRQVRILGVNLGVE